MLEKHPLTAYRETSGKTLAALATDIGVKANTIWRWENGRMPRPKDWSKIEAVTGIKASQLAAFKESASARAA